MRIGFISQGSLQDFLQTARGWDEEMPVAEILLFGFNGMREVSYEKELKEESTYFSETAFLSKRLKNVVVCGCVTNARGLKRKSAIVAEKGKILGVSDMVNAIDGEFNAGAEVRIYDTSAGKIGVIVAEDLCDPQLVHSLAICGCDYVISPFEELKGGLQSVLARAYAYCYGVPVAVCGKGGAMIAAEDGELAFSSQQSPVYTEFFCKKEYHLVERRQRIHRLL